MNEDLCNIYDNTENGRIIRIKTLQEFHLKIPAGICGKPWPLSAGIPEEYLDSFLDLSVTMKF